MRKIPSMYAVSASALFLFIGGVVAVSGALNGSGQDATSRARRANDEAAIRGLVKEYVGARERNDPAAVGALFTSDADQLVSSGEWRRGRDALVKGTLASSQRTGGNRTITLETIRFPSNSRDVAIADGRYEIIGGAGGDRRMWSTFVMTREAGTWRIAAIRNMLPAPPAQ
jgi:uncharacterized protein (TIGR02246 family)